MAMHKLVELLAIQAGLPLGSFLDYEKIRQVFVFFVIRYFQKVMSFQDVVFCIFCIIHFSKYATLLILKNKAALEVLYYHIGA
jgi:fumarate reductase subunit D